MSWRKPCRALSLTFCVYGLLGWLYIVQNTDFHIQTLPRPLTHFVPWPREDTFGSICFVVSALGFFVYLLLRERSP